MQWQLLKTSVGNDSLVDCLMTSFMVDRFVIVMLFSTITIQVLSPSQEFTSKLVVSM